MKGVNQTQLNQFKLNQDTAKSTTIPTNDTKSGQLHTRPRNTLNQTKTIPYYSFVSKSPKPPTTVWKTKAFQQPTTNSVTIRQHKMNPENRMKK